MRTIAMLLVLAGCTGDDGASVGPDAEAGDSHVTMVSCTGAAVAATVTTSGFAYSPETTTISIGEIVELMPGSLHDVNGDDPGLMVPLGGDLCFSFDEGTTGTPIACDPLQETPPSCSGGYSCVGGFCKRTYGFHCTPHGFEGAIVVE